MSSGSDLMDREKNIPTRVKDVSWLCDSVVNTVAIGPSFRIVIGGTGTL